MTASHIHFTMISNDLSTTLKEKIQQKGATVEQLTEKTILNLQYQQIKKALEKSHIILIDRLNISPLQTIQSLLPHLCSGLIIYCASKQIAKAINQHLEHKKDHLDITTVTPTNSIDLKSLCTQKYTEHLYVKAYPSYRLNRFLDTINPFLPLFSRHHMPPRHRNITSKKNHSYRHHTLNH